MPKKIVKTVPIPKMIPVFYSEKMVSNIASFSPSAGKPSEVMKSWSDLGFPLRVMVPEPVTADQFYLAHDRSYVDGVLSCRISNGFSNKSQAVADSLPWTSGAMLSAAREAIANGFVAVAPCSGFHHAGHSSGFGFCTFNGLMVTAAVLLDEGNVSRVGILDCDTHYGDGTDDIRRVLNLTAEVPHFSSGANFDRPNHAIGFLRELPSVVESFAGCDVLLYQAGADPHIDDPLGGWMTTEQLAERDRIVFQIARRIGLPVAWNLAGGYQKPLRRVLDIHDNTMRACVNSLVKRNEVGAAMTETGYAKGADKRPMTKFRISLAWAIGRLPQVEAIELAKEVGLYDYWYQLSSEQRARVKKLVEKYPVPSEWWEKLEWT